METTKANASDPKDSTCEIKFHVYRCDGKKHIKNSKKTIPIQMKSIENREDHNTFVAKLEHLGFMGWLRSFCKWEHRT